MRSSPISWNKLIGTSASPANRWPTIGRRRLLQLSYVSRIPLLVLLADSAPQNFETCGGQRFEDSLLQNSRAEVLVLRIVHGARDLEKLF